MNEKDKRKKQLLWKDGKGYNRGPRQAIIIAFSVDAPVLIAGRAFWGGISCLL